MCVTSLTSGENLGEGTRSSGEGEEPNQNALMKCVCAHKASAVVSESLISEEEMQKTLHHIILLLVSAYALIKPCSYPVECAQSPPVSPGRYLPLLYGSAWERKEEGGGPNWAVIACASFEAPKTGVGNVCLFPLIWQ